MKIVQNGFFRSCAARFKQISFLSLKALKIVTLAWNSRENQKTVRFKWKLYKTGKQCAFPKNCPKRSFQAMGSTFWPNRIFDRQSSQNRHTGLKFSRKLENSALSMKIVQNGLFRSCGALKNAIWPKRAAHDLKRAFCTIFIESALFSRVGENFRPVWRFWELWGLRFGQISFLSLKALKSVTLAWNSPQHGKTVRFLWKLYKTLFSGDAQHVLGQISFLSLKALKSVTLAWNSRQHGKTVRFLWKLYKTLFSGHAQHVLAKSHFWASKFSKSSHWPEILAKTGKQCAFHENCTKRSFQVMASTFWPNRIWERQSSQNRHNGLKFSRKPENSALFMKIVQNALFRSCEARFGEIAFVSVKVLKIVTFARNSRQNGERVRFS